jgi:plasmid replication initiation protein
MKKLIVKDNALINASYNLDLVEQRLILLAIVEARESGKGINANDPLTVHADSYINHFDVHRNTAYQALKDACKDLFARQFSYQEQRPKGVANITSRWVSQIAYVDNSATVELIFAPAIIPLITRLEQQFTSYELKQVSGLSSAYAIRLYEVLIAWRSTGKTPVIELSDFRQKLGVLETEYKRMYDFKKYVLDLAIKQINEHTDITVKVEQHKKGRVISGFSFKFKQKQQPKIENQRDPTTIDWINGVSDSEIKGMSPPQAFRYADKLYQNHEIVGNWTDCPKYEDVKIKLIKQLQEPKYVREYMKYLLACDDPFNPKTVGFKL